jgi:hypothetical protein
MLKVSAAAVTTGINPRVFLNLSVLGKVFPHKDNDFQLHIDETILLYKLW